MPLLAAKARQTTASENPQSAVTFHLPGRGKKPKGMGCLLRNSLVCGRAREFSLSEEKVYDYIKTCIRKGAQPGSFRAMGQALGMHPEAVKECIDGLQTDHSVIVEHRENRSNLYRIPGVSPGEWPPEETGLSKLDPYMTRAEYQHKIHETQSEMRRLFLEGWTFEEIQELVPNFIDEGRWSYYSVVQTITGSPDPRIQQFLKERWPTAR